MESYAEFNHKVTLKNIKYQATNLDCDYTQNALSKTSCKFYYLLIDCTWK